MNRKPDSDEQPDSQRPNLLQVIWSVIAALFGVQSDRNRQRDFRQGRASDYIVVYVLLVIALVAGMIGVVIAVLNSVG